MSDDASRAAALENLPGRIAGWHGLSDEAKSGLVSGYVAAMSDDAPRTPESAAFDAADEAWLHARHVEISVGGRAATNLDVPPWCTACAQPLAVEVEGGAYRGGRHTSVTGFKADISKYNAATMLGWRLLRFHGDLVKSGEATDTIRKVLEG